MNAGSYLHAISHAAHILSVVVWVGGMFFAYVCLRPVAAAVLEPPHRLTLWVNTFARFFPWVWLAVALLLATGFGMMFGIFGGMKSAIYIHTMMGLGLIMMAIFAHVFFAPYKRLKRAVTMEDWPEGGRQLGQIRRMVGINTLLGLLTIVVAGAGRYLAG